MTQIESPNLSYIQELAGPDENFKKEFIQIIKEEFPEELIKYNRAFQEKKWKETADIVHKIKHKFNILGMQDAYNLGVHYEMELRQENAGKHKDFEKATDQVCAFLNSI